MESNSKFFTIYLSYCWQDQDIARELAEYISQMGFNVLFDEDDEKLNLNIFNAIYKCDLILACLSKRYLSCFACQQESKYFFEKKIPSLAVSLEKDFIPGKYISKLIAGKQYKKLIKPIQYPHSKSALFQELNKIYSRLQYLDIVNQRHENRFPTDEEIVKRKAAYESNLNSLIEKEKYEVNRERDNIKKLFIYDDFDGGLMKEVPVIYRWFNKYPTVTLSNFPAFSPTGDLNDAVFPYPADSLQDLEASLKQKMSPNGRGFSPSHLNTQRTVNLCRLSIDYDEILAQKKNDKPDYAHEYYTKLLERHTRLDTTLGNNNLWRNFSGFPGPDRTEEEMEKRKKLDTDLSIMKKRRIELSEFFNHRYNNCTSDNFCKFALQMLKNNEELENFLEKKTYVEIPLPNF